MDVLLIDLSKHQMGAVEQKTCDCGMTTILLVEWGILEVTVVVSLAFILFWLIGEMCTSHFFDYLKSRPSSAKRIEMELEKSELYQAPCLLLMLS